VINGESATGATLHYMTEKPDAGDVVDQQAVAILPDDTALDVFHRVTAAAAAVVDRSLPLLVAGTAPRLPQNLALGSYFGARKPEDGRIDWFQSAAQVHNLVRGVAPPYPGAFTEVEGMRLRILRTRLVPERTAAGDRPRLFVAEGACFAACADGSILQVLAMELDGATLTAAELAARFGAKSVSLEATA
jgi:methionyl-tRNA formyltransferase